MKYTEQEFVGIPLIQNGYAQEIDLDAIIDDDDNVFEECAVPVDDDVVEECIVAGDGNEEDDISEECTVAVDYYDNRDMGDNEDEV